MIKLFQPYISEKSKENVLRVLNSTQIAQGPEVDLFEQEFADKFGFEAWQVVSLNSGTSALELAYELTGIQKGDEVITPVLTCTATNIPLARIGADIIFGDVEGHDSLNLDPQDLMLKISHETKAVVFVHFGGSSDCIRRIEDICEDYDTDLICDAAQALGNTLSRRARFSCISLQAIKSLTAGDGGILICRDRRDADKARKLRWFGYDRVLKQKLGDTDLDLAGYKMHMNDISAAIARGNLEDWDKIKQHRLEINTIYFNRGSGQGFIGGIWNPQVIGLPYVAYKHHCANKDPYSVWDGFEIGQHHYRNDKYTLFKHADSVCPNMDKIGDDYFMLPCHMGMTLEDAEHIAKTIWPNT